MIILTHLVSGQIGPDINLGVGCVIGAGCRLTVPEEVQDYTLIYGNNCTRKMLSDKPPVSS